jgi:hypothetical protein
MLRQRLDATYRKGEFPMLDRFQDEGAVDYVAFASRIGESVRLGEGEGIVASWTTDATEGFSDTQIQLLSGVMPPLTLVFMLRTMNRTARTLIQTYLGSDAADRVLAGNIGRGRAEPIRAVVWFSDLGSPRRLDFTVLGPAVNEAARIEAFCASLKQAVIVSTAFAEASGQARRRLVSVGRYAMKGIARPQEPFTLDLAHALAESGS